MPPLATLAGPARRGLLGLAALLLLATSLLSRPAAAHAVVVTSEPATGTALAAPPRRFVIRFNSRIDHARSRLVLVGPDNAQVALALMPEQDPVVVEATPDPAASLPPGAWRLRWQVLAVDGHITRGDIPFTLRPR